MKGSGAAAAAAASAAHGAPLARPPVTLRRVSRDVLASTLHTPAGRRASNASMQAVVVAAKDALLAGASCLGDLLGPAVKVYPPGTGFGELALSGDGTRRATAVASCDSSGRRAVLLYLSREHYRETYQRHIDEEWASKMALLDAMGLRDVPKRLLTKLAYAMQRDTMSAGGARMPPLYKAGDIVDGVYFIASGDVRLRMRGAAPPPPSSPGARPPSTRLREAATAGPGGHVGEAEVLAGERVRRSAAEPLGPVVFFLVPAPAFLDFVKEAPPMCAWVAALRASALAHEASVANLERAIVTAGGGRRRLAHGALQRDGPSSGGESADGMPAAVAVAEASAAPGASPSAAASPAWGSPRRRPSPPRAMESAVAAGADGAVFEGDGIGAGPGGPGRRLCLGGGGVAFVVRCRSSSYSCWHSFCDTLAAAGHFCLHCIPFDKLLHND